MSWNYRIMRHVEGGDVTYAMHEVFYDKEGAVNGWTARPVAPVSDSRDEILLVLASMADAYGHPVLSFDDGKEVEAGSVMTDNLASALKHVKDVFDPSTPLTS